MDASTRDKLLDRLVASSGKRAYRIAHSFLRDPAEAEDAVQEALSRVCQSHESLRDVDRAESWFLRIVTTSCMRTLRRRRFREAVWEISKLDAVRCNAPSSEAAFAQWQMTHELVQRVHALPTMQRASVLLRYGHDLPVDEIAVLMNVKVSTVKTHLVRGLRRLREDMPGERS